MHLAFRFITAAVAAAALFAADSAAAQGAPGQQPTRRIPGTRPSPQPSTPATPGQPAATPPAAQPPGGSASAADQTATLQALRSLDAMVIQAGTLASERANNAKLKEFGAHVAKDHQNLDEGLVRFATQRQLALGASAQMQSGEQQRLQQLQAAQGAEFDRQFIDEMVNGHMQYVQQLKDMRDRTPGKDAELKKWLDDAENIEEAHLTAARQIRQQIREESRQARTPPAR